MKFQKLIKIILLLFVLGSVTYLIAQEFVYDKTTPETKIKKTEKANKPVIAEKTKTKTTANNKKVLVPSQVVAYYFHGNFRCVTCNTIEKYSNEAITKGFPEFLKKGHLKWQVVNTDKPKNKHFVKDFELHSQSLVIIKVENGKQKEWKNLKKVWLYVKKDKQQFVNYVQKEIKTYLGEG